MEKILGNLKKGTTCTPRLLAPEPHTLVGRGWVGGCSQWEEQKAEETTKLPAPGDRDRTCFVKRPQENATKKVA